MIKICLVLQLVPTPITLVVDSKQLYMLTLRFYPSPPVVYFFRHNIFGCPASFKFQEWLGFREGKRFELWLQMR